MSRSVLLLVDDGKQHVTLLRLALMQRGYSVVVVNGAARAAEWVKERPVDALLLSAPSEADLAFFAEARPRVVVALGAGTGQGVDAVLERPIDFAELDDILQDRLRRRTSGTRARAKVVKASSS